MGSQRQFTRVKCDLHCLVKNFDGSYHHAFLNDISFGGAFLKMRDGVPINVTIGDVCELLLCDDPEFCPIQKTCRIVRYDARNMGVTFLTARDQ
jgi:c-di-GMP-binding flagellar brake protein YcgR